MEYVEKGGPTLGALYRLATTNPAVGEALLYFGRGGEPFFDLYKAFEVIRDTLGGTEKLATLGIASRAECERFTRSANDPTISGVFARHSLKYSERMANPMDQHSARTFVRCTFQRWLAHLLSTRSDA